MSHTSSYLCAASKRPCGVYSATKVDAKLFRNVDPRALSDGASKARDAHSAPGAGCSSVAQKAPGHPKGRQGSRRARCPMPDAHEQHRLKPRRIERSQLPSGCGFHPNFPKGAPTRHRASASRAVDAAGTLFRWDCPNQPGPLPFSGRSTEARPSMVSESEGFSGAVERAEQLRGSPNAPFVVPSAYGEGRANH